MVSELDVLAVRPEAATGRAVRSLPVVVVVLAGRGRLTASDPYGRMLVDQPTGEGAGTAATVAVRSGDASTPYSRLGDWFAWICLALAAAVVLRSRATPVGVRRSGPFG